MNNFNTTGVCAKSLSFDVNDEKVISVTFSGGCNGNLKGISSLIEGMDIKEAIAKLKGIPCGSKTTSCPDQLAKALEEYQNNKAQV